MSTPELITRAGLVAVAAVLLLTLAVTLLRLAALPLAAFVLAFALGAALAVLAGAELADSLTRFVTALELEVGP